MADIKIDQLEITIEVDHAAGDTAFAMLFQKYMRRWHEAEQHRKSDRHFNEHERQLPDAAGRAGP